MKYKRKCASCNREATMKYGRIKVCNDCYKYLKKVKATCVFKDVLLYTFPDSNCSVYGYRRVWK